MRTPFLRARHRDCDAVAARHAFVVTAAGFTFLAGCSMSDGVLGGLHGSDASVSGPPEASIVVLTDSGGIARAASCTNPMVRIETSSAAGTQETCVAALAEPTFLNALCTCHDASFGDSLQTRGFDSRQSAYDESRRDDSGAAVGINDAFSIGGDTDIGGSFAVAGQAASTAQLQLGSLRVRGNLRTASDLVVLGTAQVTHSAWLGGYFAAAELTVGEELHYAERLVGQVNAAKSVQEPVTVDPPCACGSDDLLPIGRIIDEAVADNDNDTIALDPGALESLQGPQTLALPCGRYYLSQIGGRGNLALDVSGKAALFLGGSLDLEGDLEVRLSSGAEIDIFIRQDMRIDGHMDLGITTRPSATRLYVGGSGEIALGDVFVGNLYAPSARVRTVSRSRVWGSIFAYDFAAPTSASTSFVYDRAITAVGSTCTVAAPTSGCDRCRGCTGGNACVANVCGPCRTDEDCCSQSVCSTNGSCALLVDIR